MTCSRAAPLLVGAFFLLPSITQAQTEARPWYLGGSVSLTQVNNVYRVSQLANSAEQVSNDDRVTGSSIYGGFNARLGRQRLRLDGSVVNNDYQRNRSLRYQGYTGRGGLDWQVGNALSGSLDFSAQRGLAPFNSGNLPSSRSKNIETNRDAALSARYGLLGPWSVDVAFGASDRDYSLASFERFELRQNSTSVGLRWSPSPALSTRLVLRHGRGTYPRFAALPASQGGGFQEDRFRRKDVDLVLTWQPSSLHALSARIGQGSTQRRLATGSNSKGTNYRLDWTWLPTSKLRLQTVLARENGADTQQFRFGEFVAGDSLSARRYDSLQLQAAYALSAKLNLNASAGESRRTVDNSVNGNTTASANDRTQTAALGLSWAYTRNGSVGCQINADRRRGAAGFGQPYSSHSVGCSLRYGIEG
jgi:hypothetical protein